MPEESSLEEIQVLAADHETVDFCTRSVIDIDILLLSHGKKSRTVSPTLPKLKKAPIELFVRQIPNTID